MARRIPNGISDLSMIEMRPCVGEYFSDDERVAEYQAPGRRTKGRKHKSRVFEA